MGTNTAQAGEPATVIQTGESESGAKFKPTPWRVSKPSNFGYQVSPKYGLKYFSVYVFAADGSIVATFTYDEDDSSGLELAHRVANNANAVEHMAAAMAALAVHQGAER